MREQQNLFETREWLGVFFSPEQFENRFPGNLKCSPSNGVVLSYLVPSHDRIPPTEVLHGILDNGEKCTLLGNFDMRFSGRRWCGDQNTQFGNQGFKFARMGGHHSADALISGATFSLTGLQDFFFRTGFKDDLRFSEDPEVAIDLRFGILEVSHVGSFNFVSDDIRPLFYCPDPSALEDLQIEYDRILKKNPRAILMFKNDISYQLHLRFSPSTKIQTAYEKINSISNLFALLLNRPCHPERISVTECDSIDEVSGYLYPSLALNSSTIELCNERTDHRIMPINGKMVNLDCVVGAWIDSDGRFDDLISDIQYGTGETTAHAIKGNILLYTSQLESIAHTRGITRKRYEFAVSNFSDFQTHEFLQSLFNVNSIEKLGVAIGDLRNDIAHFGRPKKYLGKLSGVVMHKISICLELIVLGYVLDQLGVASKTWRYYQVYFLPKR